MTDRSFLIWLAACQTLAACSDPADDGSITPSGDTSGPEDTSTPEDTSVPEDTGPTGDSSLPEDTGPTGDSSQPEDTAPTGDTSLPEDTGPTGGILPTGIVTCDDTAQVMWSSPIDLDSGWWFHSGFDEEDTGFIDQCWSVMPWDDRPHAGHLQNITGTTTVSGFYHHPVTSYYWTGFGDLCGAAASFRAGPPLPPIGDSWGWDSDTGETADPQSDDTAPPIPWYADTAEDYPWDHTGTLDTASPYGTSEMWEVTCNGSDVTVTSMDSTFLDWITPIDSPEEAYLAFTLDPMAWGSLYTATSMGRSPGMLYKEVGDDYELFVRQVDYGCTDYIRWARYLVEEDGTVSLITATPWVNDGTVCGRLTTGVRLAAPMAHTFASYAGLEAAAALAFDRMADQLTLLGAPADLVADCRTAAGEERIHARLQTELAAAHGLTPVDVEVDPFRPVSLYEFAVDNRLEGCVRETFGAMTGRWQADRLPEGPIRDVWQQITADEEGHAALSWRVAEWAEAQLTDDERAELDRQATALLATLADGHDAPEGLPVVPEGALRLFRAAIGERLNATLAA